MTDNAIVPVSDNRYLSPAATIEQAIARYAMVVEFTKRVMRENMDYGIIPGTTQPTLLKPGAEKLSSLFGLSSAFGIAEKDLDWTGEKHGGEPFFYFQYICTMYSGERIIAQGVGSCNSWEKKYRYRNADRLCPVCNKPTIIKGRAEYGGGWLCFAKKGGCGAKFSDGDQAIEGQHTGQVKNPDPADIVNTIDKMAQKRALIAATLIATNASEYFTQDLEDFGPIEGVYTDAPQPKPAPAERKPDPSLVVHDVPPMTIEEAENTLNRNGTRYGDITTDDLHHMINSLAKVAKRTPEQEAKLLAIQIILADRAAEAKSPLGDVPVGPDLEQ